MDLPRARAVAETVATALLWGTSFPIISYGISIGLDTRLFVFLRFAIAAPILLLISRAVGASVASVLRSRAVWVLGLLNAVGFVAQFLGQAYTQASVAALLVNLSVLIAATGSAIVLGERFTRTKAGGTSLAVLGTILLATKGNLSGLAGSQLLGELLCLVSAFTWGAYIIYNKQQTEASRWDPLGATASIVLVTALFVTPVAFFSSQSLSDVSQVQWTILGYTALMNTAVPFILYQRGLRFLTATASSIILLLEIVTAVVISVAFLGEVITPAAALGALLILLSTFLVSRAEVGGKSLSITDTDLSEGEGVSNTW